MVSPLKRKHGRQGLIDPWDIVEPSLLETELHILSGDNWKIDDAHMIIQASGYLKGIDPDRDGERRLFIDGEWRKV